MAEPVPAAETITVRYVEGTVSCDTCDWAATLTGDLGDPVAEVEAILLARLREHTRAQHPRH
jgi:hypothetical protein